MSEFWQRRSPVAKATIVMVGGTVSGVFSIWGAAITALLLGCLSAGYCGG